MSALENVAFAERARGVRRATARDRAMGWLRDLEAADLATSDPTNCRADRPSVWLWPGRWPPNRRCSCSMNHWPPSTPGRRRHPANAQARAGRAQCDPGHSRHPDAALLADCIAVMDRGRIVGDRPTEQILHRPRTLFAAQLCGLNLIDGLALRQDAITTAEGHTVVGVAQAPLTPEPDRG